jgi:GTPase SAR1 family protein
LIMVGSGGVGKSALTLQFMYDEVGWYIGFFQQYYLIKFSLLKNMSRLKLIPTVKESYWMGRSVLVIFWTQPVKKIIQP